MTADAGQTVLSLLCDPEIWHWDTSGSCNIAFRKNGTGLLRAGAEISIFIAAEFDWKLKDPASLDNIANLSNNSKKKLVSELEIEMTLTTRLHPLLRGHRQDCTLLNEQALTDAAFRPKTYTICLEHGRFNSPDVPWLTSRPFLLRPPMYALRLVFDKSPFPPLEEWNDESRDVAEQCGFSDLREFADRRVARDSVVVALLRKVGPWGR